MEDFWKRAKVFAEEAAKKSQTYASSDKLADLVAETAKKSKELALEASKKADQLKSAALKQANQIQQIKSISDIIPPKFSSPLSLVSEISSSSSSAPSIPDSELLKLGITDDLRDFVRGLTPETFRNFPIQSEDAQETNAATSNVRKDLTEWQEHHAKLVLASVKPIAKLRYDLCPRVMKEKIFWKIYFTLVGTYVAPFERQYMEELSRKKEEQIAEEKAKQASAASTVEMTEKRNSLQSKTSNVSTADEDLDTFLLGDLEEDSDTGGADDGGRRFDDDDFDKIDNSDVDDEKSTQKTALDI